MLLTDILPTGYLGARRASIAPGSTVVVVGLGPVGVMAVQCAALFSPARILAIDVVPERLARAEQLGAEAIDARQAPGHEQVMAATGGRGAESVIEAVGSDVTVVDAVSCAAVGGTVSVVGVNLTMDLPFPMGLVFLKSLTLRAVFAPIPGTWATLVPLVLAGRFSLAETFTHHMGLSQVSEAYELFDRVPVASSRSSWTRSTRRSETLRLVGRAVAHDRPLRLAQLGRTTNHGAGGGTRARSRRRRSARS